MDNKFLETLDGIIKFHEDCLRALRTVKEASQFDFAGEQEKIAALENRRALITDEIVAKNRQVENLKSEASSREAKVREYELVHGKIERIEELDAKILERETRLSNANVKLAELLEAHGGRR